MDKNLLHKANPFPVEDVEYRTMRRKGNAVEYVDPQSGEVLGSGRKGDLYESELHDHKTYTKVFTRLHPYIATLSGAAIKVLFYIIQHQTVGRDTVTLEADTIRLYWGESFGKSSYYKAVNELIEKDILARKYGSYIEYFVNPNVCFNGDRRRLYRQQQDLL